VASKRQAKPSAIAGRVTPLRIGFIDLIDAAPLIVALERGFFADEGLNVTLERQLGWGSIRDRLTFGQLDAAHALVGMPLFSHLGRDWFVEPLVALMNLGAGGDAITLSRRLIDAGVRSADTLAQYIDNDPRREAMVFGHVFSCSIHHYLLREWLSSDGIDPDRDVRLRVFPPNQLALHMSHGHVDGFCVGEPWNTVAQLDNTGQIVAFTTQIMPSHPDKVLAVTRRWMRANDSLGVPLTRAVLRACAFCEDAANREILAEMLSRPQYLNTSREIIRRCLDLSPPMRSFAPANTIPSMTHSAWILSQMIRWKQVPPETDLLSPARSCVESSAYRIAASELGIDCPEDDFAPMALRRGWFDPRSTSALEVPVLEGAVS
jgi:two-component system, oxyanion-binding sensor